MTHTSKRVRATGAAAATWCSPRCNSATTARATGQSQKTCCRHSAAPWGQAPTRPSGTRHPQAQGARVLMPWPPAPGTPCSTRRHMGSLCCSSQATRHKRPSCCCRWLVYRCRVGEGRWPPAAAATKPRSTRWRSSSTGRCSWLVASRTRSARGRTGGKGAARRPARPAAPRPPPSFFVHSSLQTHRALQIHSS
jgi:hypothetical protein